MFPVPVELQIPFEQGMVKSIKKIASVLDSNNVNYWLTGGALLGMIRDQKLIPWDDDVEIGLWKKDRETVANLFGQFKEEGFEIDINKIDKVGLHLPDGLDYKIRLIFFSIDKEYAVRVKLARSNIRKLATFYRNIYNTKSLIHNLITKFNWDSNKSTKIHTASKYRYSIPVSYFESIVKLSFYETYINIPKNPEKYLEYRYGSSWKTPSKSWTDNTDIDKTFFQQGAPSG